MQGYVVLLIVCLGGLALSWFRYDAGKQRKATMARLSEEAAATGVVSPTEELFRSEGVPVPADLLPGLATAPPPPPKLVPVLQSARQSIEQLRLPGTPAAAAAAAAALRTPSGPPSLGQLVAGIALPCDLVPLLEDGQAAFDRGTASFVTATASGSALHDELHTAFARIGCSVSWIDTSTAHLRRDDATAIVRIVERDDDVVVTITAT